jgi:hypothetical protein
MQRMNNNLDYQSRDGRVHGLPYSTRFFEKK